MKDIKSNHLRLLFIHQSHKLHDYLALAQTRQFSSIHTHITVILKSYFDLLSTVQKFELHLRGKGRKNSFMVLQNVSGVQMSTQMYLDQNWKAQFLCPLRTFYCIVRFWLKLCQSSYIKYEKLIYIARFRDAENDPHKCKCCVVVTSERSVG